MKGVINIKKHDLDRVMRSLGYKRVSGGKHDLYKNGSHTIAVPRANEIKEGTANAILKCAGLKKDKKN
jgi:predicted RNA binding protein YcfA (HicA-like mRNA interferase family)